MQQPVAFISKLNKTYDAMRNIQAVHDKSEYRCIGSGRCCQIGLLVPLAECANIARELKRHYFIKAEAEGFTEADRWFSEQTTALVNRMYDSSWDSLGNTDLKCAFFSNGCSIYEYRPMVCRAYGVFMPVAESCPRKRLEDGTTYIFHDSTIEQLITEWEESIDIFSAANEAADYTVYMPMGVLKFLLSDEELIKLHGQTDNRFWKAVRGNSHRFRPKDWKDD